MTEQELGAIVRRAIIGYPAHQLDQARTDLYALVGEIKRLRAKLAEVKREREAAVICDGCKFKSTVGCHCHRAQWRDEKGGAGWTLKRL